MVRDQAAGSWDTFLNRPRGLYFPEACLQIRPFSVKQREPLPDAGSFFGMGCVFRQPVLRR